MEAIRRGAEGLWQWGEAMSELPYNKTVEEDCLGGLMVCTYYLSDPEYKDYLSPHDFYIRRHQRIYKAMQDLTARDIEPHEINVKTELQRTGILNQVGGREYIRHLVYCALSRPGERGFDPCNTIAIVRDYRLRRDALIKAQGLAQAALDYSKPLQVTP